MGNQQNPDGIYQPPGNTSRYPLDPPKPKCSCFPYKVPVTNLMGKIVDHKIVTEYNPECDVHGQSWST